MKLKPGMLVETWRPCWLRKSPLPDDNIGYKMVQEGVQMVVVKVLPAAGGKREDVAEFFYNGECWMTLIENLRPVSISWE